MVINTLRFGRLHVDESKVITIPKGLFGYANHQRFVLISESAASRVLFLQSLDNPKLCFLTSDEPRMFDPAFELEISDTDRMDLSLLTDEDKKVIVTVSVENDTFTANLAGPILINTKTGRAKQAVIDKDEYMAGVPLKAVGGKKKRKDDKAKRVKQI